MARADLLGLSTGATRRAEPHSAPILRIAPGGETKSSTPFPLAWVATRRSRRINELPNCRGVYSLLLKNISVMTGISVI
jgi:hypothetical protein